MANNKKLTLDEVLRQCLASYNEESEVEILSDDSYDEEVASEIYIHQHLRNLNEEQLVLRILLFDILVPCT